MLGIRNRKDDSQRGTDDLVVDVDAFPEAQNNVSQRKETYTRPADAEEIIGRSKDCKKFPINWGEMARLQTSTLAWNGVLRFSSQYVDVERILSSLSSQGDEKIEYKVLEWGVRAVKDSVWVYVFVVIAVIFPRYVSSATFALTRNCVGEPRTHNHVADARDLSSEKIQFIVWFTLGTAGVSSLCHTVGMFFHFKRSHDNIDTILPSALFCIAGTLSCTWLVSTFAWQLAPSVATLENYRGWQCLAAAHKLLREKWTTAVRLHAYFFVVVLPLYTIRPSYSLGPALPASPPPIKQFLEYLLFLTWPFAWSSCVASFLLFYARVMAMLYIACKEEKGEPIPKWRDLPTHLSPLMSRQDVSEASEASDASEASEELRSPESNDLSTPLDDGLETHGVPRFRTSKELEVLLETLHRPEWDDVSSVDENVDQNKRRPEPVRYPSVKHDGDASASWEIRDLFDKFDENSDGLAYAMDFISRQAVPSGSKIAISRDHYEVW